MANVAIKDNHLTYNGVKYFRGHAEMVELGSIGEKRSPITSQNYLEVKDRIPAGKINDYGTVKTSLVEINFTETTSASITATVQAVIGGVPIGLAPSIAWTKLSNYELKMVKFSVLTNEMKAAANHSPQKLESLADWGNDARIAHQIWVVMDAKYAVAYNRSGSATLSVAGGVLQASVSNDTSGAYTVKIPAGTTFAYLLAKIDWNRGKTQIDDLDDDQWSFS